ncbi:hypothetical protein FRC09_020663 [Ceratobasidium sp. 395]|nr:hypothetical protein FRC09_020663 [Ceratobasidium sp. 395]
MLSRENVTDLSLSEFGEDVLDVRLGGTADVMWQVMMSSMDTRLSHDMCIQRDVELRTSPKKSGDQVLPLSTGKPQSPGTCCNSLAPGLNSNSRLQETEREIKNELKIWKLLKKNVNIVPLLGLIRGQGRQLDPESSIPPWPVSEWYEDGGLNNASTLTKFLKSRKDLDDLTRLALSNVIVGNQGKIAKICDFGSARIDCGCGEPLEDPLGTAQWDSPELQNDAPRSSSSDIWAFGCVALETQFNKTPYVLNDMRTYQMQRKGLPPATSESIDFEVSFVSRGIWSIMQECWEREPTKRPKTPNVLAELEVLKVKTRPTPWYHLV